MCKGTQSSIDFLWGAMLSFRAVQQSIQQPNVLPAIASCVCVCFLFLSLNFLLVKGRHRNARSQIPLDAMTNNQWNQLRNAKWQQTCVFVCVIPLQTIFTLKALPEKTMNLLSHPTIKDVHHYRIVSMWSLVPQNLQQVWNIPPVEELTIPSRRLRNSRNSWDTSSTKYKHISISIIPGSSVRDLFGGFSLVTFSGVKTWPLFGESKITWKKLVHGFNLIFWGDVSSQTHTDWTCWFLLQYIFQKTTGWFGHHPSEVLTQVTDNSSQCMRVDLSLLDSPNSLNFRVKKKTRKMLNMTIICTFIYIYYQHLIDFYINTVLVWI